MFSGISGYENFKDFLRVIIEYLKMNNFLIKYIEIIKHIIFEISIPFILAIKVIDVFKIKNIEIDAPIKNLDKIITENAFDLPCPVNISSTYIVRSWKQPET